MSKIENYLELLHDKKISENSGRLESAKEYEKLAQKTMENMSKKEKFIIATILNLVSDSEALDKKTIDLIKDMEGQK